MYYSSVEFYPEGTESTPCPPAPLLCIQPPSTPIDSVFQNLQSTYWYAEEKDSSKAWVFGYNIQSNVTVFGSIHKNIDLYGWAVRDVSAVLVPAAAWLFASALTGLVGLKRKK